MYHQHIKGWTGAYVMAICVKMFHVQVQYNWHYQWIYSMSSILLVQLHPGDVCKQNSSNDRTWLLLKCIVCFQLLSQLRTTSKAWSTWILVNKAKTSQEITISLESTTIMFSSLILSAKSCSVTTRYQSCVFTVHNIKSFTKKTRTTQGRLLRSSASTRATHLQSG